MNILKSGLLAVALAATVTAGAAAQQHRHTPRPATVNFSQSAGGQQRAASAATDTTGVDAFSDTTSAAPAASADTLPAPSAFSASANFDDDGFPFGLWPSFWGAETLFWLVIALIGLVFLAPVIGLAVLFILLYRYRQRKRQVAGTAQEAGQTLHERPASRPGGSGGQWAAGVQQCCLGAGLMAFFAIVDIKFGIGFGALLVCVGAGKMIVARSSRKKERNNDEAV